MKSTYNAELMFFTFRSSCSILAFVSSINSITVAGLAQSVEHLTTERKVEGSIPGMDKYSVLQQKLERH